MIKINNYPIRLEKKFFIEFVVDVFKFRLTPFNDLPKDYKTTSDLVLLHWIKVIDSFYNLELIDMEHKHILNLIKED